jgi:hypothetical protein
MARDLTPSPHLTLFLEENGSRGREMLLPALLRTQKIHDFVPEEAASDNEYTQEARDPQAKIPDYNVCSVVVKKLT